MLKTLPSWIIFVLLKSSGIGPDAVVIIFVMEPSALVTSNSSGSCSDSELYPSALGALLAFDVSSSSESEDSILMPS